MQNVVVFAGTNHTTVKPWRNSDKSINSLLIGVRLPRSHLLTALFTCLLLFSPSLSTSRLQTQMLQCDF